MPAPTPGLRRQRISVAAGFFLQGLVFAAVVTQVPALQDKIGLGAGDVTLLLVIVAVVSGLGSVIAGVIAERRTSAVAYRIALATIGFGALLIGLAPDKTTLIAAFVLYGLGIGSVDACMNMQGVRVQSAYGYSIMGNFHGVWSVAGIVGALYAAAAAGLDVPLGASLTLIAVIAWVTIAIVGGNFFEAQEHEVARAGEPVHVPWRPVLVFGLVIVIFYAADTGILTWSSVYLHDALDASKTLAPFAYAAYQAGAIVSRFGGDHLVRRRGASYVVRLGTIVGLVGLIGVVAAPVPLLAIGSFFVVGLGLAILAPLAFVAVAAAVGDAGTDVAIARLNIANYMGAILGGGLIGAAATGGLLRWAFVIPLAVIPLILFVSRSFATAESDRTGQ